MYNFCGFKTEYILTSEFPKLSDRCIEEPNSSDSIFALFDKYHAELPVDWDFSGTDMYGAAGYVLIFEVDRVPEHLDLLKIDGLIRKMESELD